MVTETKKIALLGGDGRFLRLAELLAADGAEVCAYALGDALPDCAVRCASISDAVAGADAVLLPVPYSRDGTHLNAPLHPEPVPLDALLAHATDGLPIFGGMLPKGGFPGCVCLDYYSERMQIRNAVPSAEGALMIALERMPGTLHGSSAFVIGYGRIGKLLADRLRAFGANVTVFARKESDRAFAEAFSCHAAPIEALAERLSEADVLFNTAPAALARARGARRAQARSGVHRTGFTALLRLRAAAALPRAARAHVARRSRTVHLRRDPPAPVSSRRRMTARTNAHAAATSRPTKTRVWPDGKARRMQRVISADPISSNSEERMLSLPESYG